MKKFTTTALVAFVMLVSFACDSTKNEGSVETAKEANEEKLERMNMEGKKDQADFMVKAASGGMMEVELGRMASERAQNAEVKSFGQMMVTDHSKANQDLISLAATKNITVPATPGAEHQEHIDRLSKLTGAEFDKEYMSMMVEDHNEDIELFREAAEAYDDDVKSFASKTLPVLEKHLQRAKEINEKVKNMK